MVEQQKKPTRHYNEALSGTFVESDVATCLTLKQDVIAHGPCNCGVCQQDKCDCTSSPIL